MKHLKFLAATLALVAFAFAATINAADNPTPADNAQKAASCCMKDTTQTGTCPAGQCGNQVCFVNATGDGPCLNCMGGPAAKCDSCTCKSENAGKDCCKKNCPKAKAGEKPAK